MANTKQATRTCKIKYRDNRSTLRPTSKRRVVPTGRFSGYLRVANRRLRGTVTPLSRDRFQREPVFFHSTFYQYRVIFSTSIHNRFSSKLVRSKQKSKVNGTIKTSSFRILKLFNGKFQNGRNEWRTRTLPTFFFIFYIS